MISVIIPTLNAEASLGRTLSALVPAAVDGLVREVIVVDAGSTDGTRRIVDGAGADLVAGGGGRGRQLAAGAARARFPWLLFLHADTVLEGGWERDASKFMERIDLDQQPAAAAAFRFALDDEGMSPRLLERVVALRCSVLRLPYGDQGLLMPKALYDEVGGFSQLPLMEDVEMIRKLGRRRVRMLASRAITSAERYRTGYFRRSARNLLCLTLYSVGVPVRVISRIYG